MKKHISDFKEVWLADFEYFAPQGEKPDSICMVAKEINTGKVIKLWADELKSLDCAPYSVGEETLFVSYSAPAELNCFLALGWPLPVYVLDLFVEFRCLTNGLPLPGGDGQLGALLYYELDGLGFEEKESMRALAIRGGPWNADERKLLIDYCETDVVALEKLLPVMLPNINLPQALLRGRYTKAVSRIENEGIPISVNDKKLLQDNWENIQDRLIAEIDSTFGVYEGRSFKREKFVKYLIENQLPWPLLASGVLALDDDTFRDMSMIHPQVAPLRELKHALSQMRLSNISLGKDGRNRTSLSAFRATTGRNQPSTAKFIFGNSSWLRFLIKPAPDYSLAYIDWSQQEFGIAAALSNDPKMKAAYLSGDPYLAFAIQAKAVPPDGTKKTHGKIRDQFKQCVLAVQYGMGEDSLAIRINQPTFQARALLQLHRETYPTFWSWSDAALDHAMLNGSLSTVFGWKVHVGAKPNPRSLRNFPMQANGAEMLRLAACLITEAGIAVCAPVHDAILILAPTEKIQEHIETSQKLMEDASAVVLGGFRLSSDVKTVHYPDRYQDGRGAVMWETSMRLVDEIQSKPTRTSELPARMGAELPEGGCVPGPSYNVSNTGNSTYVV